jgi:tetratricopeptide (TPR) repeat protein
MRCLLLICWAGCSLAMLHAQTERDLFRRGLERLEIKDFSGAESDFSMVLQLNPRSDAAYFNRGYARMQLGDFSGAVQDFNLSLDINPSNAEGYYNRGRARLGLEDYLGALMDFNLSIKGQPRDDRYYQARARAKSGLQDYRGAILDLNEAISLSKSKKPAYIFDRAEAYINLRDFDLAIQDLDWVVRRNPLDPNAYNARAQVKLQGGDLDGACLDWSKAGELGDVNAYTLIRKHCNN